MEFCKEFDALEPAEIVHLLKKKDMDLTPEIENKILSEEVNGETLRELDTDELKEIGFNTLGQRKKISRIIRGQTRNRIDPNSTTTTNQTLQCFSNLHDYVATSEFGDDILMQLEKDGHLNQQNKNSFVKICTKLLIEEAVKQGQKENYPTSGIKTQLAKAIVSTFPCLKSTLPGCKGYEHFYDGVSGSGYIENRLRTIRRKLPQDVKPYKKRTPTKRKQPDDEANSDDSVETVDVRDSEEMVSSKEKIEWLQNTVLNPVTKTSIYEAMQDTFQYRRQEVDADHPSITILLEHYPRFKDDMGGLIEQEFKQLFPDQSSIIPFKDLAVRLPDLNMCRNHSIESDDEILKAILLLNKLLPSVNIKKQKSGEQPVVILFKGAGFDAESFAKEKPPGMTQPFLLAVGKGRKPDEYFLILDSTAIPLGQDILTAFYRLFSSFWVFDVHYYCKLSSFYNFWECLLLRKKPHCTVRSLLAALDFVHQQ